MSGTRRKRRRSNREFAARNRGGSYNETLGEKWDDDYLDRASSATCPECGHKVYFETLKVAEDCTWCIG